jgi:predicted RND superfamily exporter protein
VAGARAREAHLTDPAPLLFAAVAAGLLAAALAAAALRPGWTVAWPRCVLALLGIVTLAAVAALVETAPLRLALTLDPSTEPLLPAGDPAVEVYREAVRDFGDDQVFVIAMETEDVFRADQLAALRRVTDGISRLEGVRSVESLTSVISFRYDAGSEWIEVRPLIGDVPTDAEALRALREHATRDPVYRETLVSSDGRTAAVNVSFQEMTDREFIAADLDGRIRALLARETLPTRRFHLSGRPHIKSRMYAFMVRDLRVLIPLSLAVVAAALGLISGSVRGVVLPLATVGAAVIWTFGAIAFLGRPLTVLSVLLAPTLVAVGSVYGVHVVSRFQEEVLAGGDRQAVVLRCLEHMVAPVLIAGLTTLVGFGALLITDVPAVFEVGACSALGIASVTLISLTGIPAALMLLPLRRGVRGGARLRLARRLGALLDRALLACADRARRSSGAVIAVFAGLAALAAALVPRVVIDTDYLSFFDEEAEVRREFEAVNRLLAGVVPLFLVVEGAEAGGLRDPQALASIERLQRRIDAVPDVSRTLSFLDTMRVLNRAIEGDDPAAERLPDTRAGVTELFFLIPKSDLQRLATVDQSRANLIIRTGEVGSEALRGLSERIQAAVATEPLPAGFSSDLTGNAILLTRAADDVARAQPRTVALAALTIFLLLSAGLRSLRLGLVAMIPNVVPVLVFFGILGAGAAPLSLPTSLIALRPPRRAPGRDRLSGALPGLRERRVLGAPADPGVRRALGRDHGDLRPHRPPAAPRDPDSRATLARISHQAA